MPEEDALISRLEKRCIELQDTIELAVDLLEKDDFHSAITDQVLELLRGVL